MLEESLNCEFKQEYTDDIKRTVVAFANSEGGDIYIGIKDNGDICGVSNTDKEMLKVTSLLHDSILPDVTHISKVSVSKIDGKNVIKIHVERGSSRPYYLAGKGIRPEGVMIRHGASTIQASQSVILDMIKESSNDSFERGKSVLQELTFKHTKKYFQKKKIKFGEIQLRTLFFKDNDGIFTNLGWLFSDQCSISLKIAVFQGIDKNILKDRLEINASILEQLEQAYDYIDKNNRTKAEFNGLNRIDIRDYPCEALRESLLNTIVHRDYSYNSPILISIFDDRIEFLNIGGLITGVSYDDIMMGISVSRNPNLANVFYRLKLVEAYGIGISKIMGSYSDFPQKPKIEIANNSFKITLPNKNYDNKKEKKQSVSISLPFSFTENEEAIINYLKKHKKATRKEIEQLLNKSQTATIQIIKEMLIKNILIREGNNRSFTYSLNKTYGRL